ncbi:hypothetical protein [Paenibacillus sp. Soil522]|uniref:hypothetical protein n=1 Tax=Paenibacillus sp. Soil522 TaxID=1736388 RepID=UPI0006FF6E3B|nr:hypothetical protein [Paenibacillus sp. Soil522]KRE45827.1 hypothetical protein ASG81_12420 [Paenibacillus sp. Soil522]
MDVSEIISSSIFDYQVNTPITIYEGEMLLTSEHEKSILINGKIELNWLPVPQLYFEGYVIKGLSDYFHLKFVNYNLSTNSGFSSGIMITSVTHASDTSNKIEGICKNEISKGSNELTKLEFGIVNFINMHGDFIKKGALNYTGRTELLYKDWKITIIKRYDCKSYYEQLNKKGGYGVTHIGVLEKLNKSSFNYSDVIDLLENVSWVLSFCAGRSVGISVLNGFNGEHLVRTIYQLPIITDWKKQTTWLAHPVTDVGINDLFINFNQLLNNPLWTKTIKIILLWYFDCYVSTYTENKIVTTQMALEMLAWTYLVEDQAILTKQEFKARDMTAYKRIKKLLETQSIKFDIPDVHSLTTYKNKCDDGIHLLTRVRNSIAHPVKETDIASMNSTIKYGVLCMGTQFLELSILHILKYKSEIHNRLSPSKWLGETNQLVPWVIVENKDVKPDLDE